MDGFDAVEGFVYAVAYPDADEYEIVSRADLTLAAARREAAHGSGPKVVVRRPVGPWETVRSTASDKPVG